jgi:hypothetical protein
MHHPIVLKGFGISEPVLRIQKTSNVIAELKNADTPVGNGDQHGYCSAANAAARLDRVVGWARAYIDSRKRAAGRETVNAVRLKDIRVLHWWFTTRRRLRGQPARIGRRLLET